MGCRQCGGLMSTELLCSHSHCMTTWGPGQESQCRAEQLPHFSWQGGLDRDFPLKAGQIFIPGLQWFCKTQCLSPPVLPVNSPRHESLCCSQQQPVRGQAFHWDSRASTTGYHHWLCPCQRPWKWFKHPSFFFSLPALSDEVCFV